ncbi:MAG: hypothetical protein H6711_14275 [Myxococcales bacterium]|nr:hypothetical protein [Myxococcales bacterium]
MAGIITQIIPKQRFDFTWLGNNATKTIVLHSALNVVPYYYARFAVRLHATCTLVTGQSVDLEAFGTDPSPDDPTEFTKTGTAALSASIDDSTSVPSLLSATASDLDPFLKLILTFNQCSTGGTPFWVELSADLILREG